ncbi:hypothetical protein [Dokdonia sp. Asnod1-B02]|uniref:hypothetical protein n=1 Tax=Dokdonia sp. Asnod1-B02 TaxID=3160573 RepID=UPI003866F06E
MKKQLLMGCFALGAILVSCDSDDDTTTNAITPEAGTLAGGPFTFFVDGAPDMVTGVTITGELAGDVTTFVVTDDSKNILGIPPTLEALEGVNFDDAGVGACYIYHLAYQDGLSGLATGENLDDFAGDFELSNFLVVNRNAGPLAAEIVGGPFEFCVDGTPDMVSGLSLMGDSVGSENSWVITTDTGEILGLPPTLDAVQGVNFDDAGAGICLIWYLRYEPGLEGLEVGANANDLTGVFDLSEPVEVVRNEAIAAEITGGPFTFTVDGTPDMVSGLGLTGESVGALNSWVITTDTGEILGLPPTLAAVEGVNFDDAGTGVCLIWYLRYEEGLTGLMVGANANDLSGCFDLSEPVTVTRN